MKSGNMSFLTPCKAYFENKKHVCSAAELPPFLLTHVVVMFENFVLLVTVLDH